MKTATIRDLRNEFARLSKWLDKGESVQILKRGKPFARVGRRRASQSNRRMRVPAPIS